MSELNINDLPCEILATIFQLLDVVSLKEATLACKLWNNVIESGCRWSLGLSVKHNADQKIHFIMTTNRRIGKIEIWGGTLSGDSPIRSIFQRHGFNVVELTLRSCTVDNLTAVTELFKLTPNLKYVYMSHTTISDSVSSDTQLGQRSPQLNKLKSLDFFRNDLRMVQCFGKTKLRELKIWEDESKHHGLLLDFILSQDTLTSLVVDRSPSMLVDLGKLKVPFRLMQLAVGDNDDNDNSLRFVKSQAQNLRELEVEANLLSFVHECIIEIMPKLNTLSLVSSDENGFPDFDIIEGLQTNGSVRTIKLLGFISGNRGAQSVGKFLRKLPNVRSLVLLHSSCNWSTVASVMAQSLKNLESLAIGFYINEHFFDAATFSNLKTLHINYLRAKIDWNKFSKAHPLLTELTIENMNERSHLTTTDIDQMTTNVDLQRIRLGVGMVVGHRFFEIIRTKCKNLKVLDLHKSCSSHGVHGNMRINALRWDHDIKCSETFHLMLSEDRFLPHSFKILQLEWDQWDQWDIICELVRRVQEVEKQEKYVPECF